MRIALVPCLLCCVWVSLVPVHARADINVQSMWSWSGVRQQDLELASASMNTSFSAWVSAFKLRARREGISGTTLDRAFHGVRYNADVIAKDRNQSEFVKQIWDYLDSAASPVRIRNGVSAMRRYKRVFDRIETRFGVDRHVVAAIWGVESAYGTTRGDIPVIEALATLAFDGRRGRFFTGQLLEALRILQAGDTTPRLMTGSWAGAMGHTQFIPSSFRAFAVDGDGDGKRDIWSDDPTDALASTAAYLARHGWRKGQPWGVEVRLPDEFDYSLARRDLRESPSYFTALGVRGVDGRAVPNYGRGSILLPAGAQGAAFMIFDNFAVLERYNKADAYVIGVGHLSDRLRGGAPVHGDWPRGYRPLSFDEKKQMQRILKSKGFLDDKVDGLIGPNTINAIRDFQRTIGVPPDGYPSKTLLGQLR